MLALATGVLVFLILIKAYKILGVLAVSAVILIILFSTILTIYPGEAERSRINSSHINQLLRKDGGSILSRRMILWEPSFEAAKIGGAAGLGYGISAPNIKISELTGSYYENGRYVREKGNSVLALIEEVGIVGLAAFPLNYWICPLGFTKTIQHSASNIQNCHRA